MFIKQPPLDFTCNQIFNDSTLKPNDHMIIKNNFPGLFLQPTTQPCKYDFTLKPNDIRVMSNLFVTLVMTDEMRKL